MIRGPTPQQNSTWSSEVSHRVTKGHGGNGEEAHPQRLPLGGCSHVRLRRRQNSGDREDPRGGGGRWTAQPEGSRGRGPAPYETVLEDRGRYTFVPSHRIDSTRSDSHVNSGLWVMMSGPLGGCGWGGGWACGGRGIWEPSDPSLNFTVNLQLPWTPPL